VYSLSRAAFLCLVTFSLLAGGCTSSNTTSDPRPTIAALSPMRALAGDAGFTLTIKGSHFAPTSVARWNEMALTTTFVSDSELKAEVRAEQLATVGVAHISVADRLGGAASDPIEFAVDATNPVPTILSVSPNSMTTGSAAFTLTVTGSNFIASSLIEWNGLALPTTYVSATQLTVQISASQLLSAGVVNVSIFTGTPGGGASGTMPFTVSVPAGASPVTVPNEVGQTQATATSGITGLGLTIGTVTMASSSTVASGKVIAESPSSGTQVASGSAVSLVVSTGLAQVTVPNVVGDTQNAASIGLIGVGLTVGTVTTTSSNTVASGDVISQIPSAGTTVSSGSSVNLSVSTGPPPVTVPNVVDDTQAAATTAITGAGLTVGTVTTQSSATVPSGEVISESPAAGTSVAHGSAVNLVVSSGSVSSGPPVVWIPFEATPLAADGLIGLFLQASNNHTAPTSANFVTTSAVTILSSAYAETVSGTNYTIAGQVLIYQGLGGDGNTHIYGLDLRNASSGTLPVPTQLSNLSIPPANLTAICDYGNAQTSQLDPTTQFVVLHLPGTGDACGSDTSTGDSWVLVSYGTAASAAPTTLNITTTDVSDDIYASDTSSLAGFVTLDYTNSTVYYYPYSGGTFGSPVALKTGVCTSESDVGSNTGSRLYLVTTGTNCDITNPEYLYWLTYSGSGTPTFTQVFTLAGTATFVIRDDNNYFLKDTVQGGTVYLRQGSLSTGDITTTLYSFPQSTTSDVQMEGSNDTVMLVYQSTKSGSTTSYTLGTLPVGTASGSISTVESLGTLAIAPAVDWAPTNALLNSTRGNIYITEYQTIGSASSQVITLSGTVLQSLLAHSAFGLDGIVYPAILQFKGITDTTGETEGGATVYAVSTSGTGLASTVFTLPGGGAYAVPANTITEFSYEAASSSYLLGGMEFIDETTGTVGGGIYDAGSEVVFPFSFADTEIALAEAD
jgi:beta-lactam-binding protein with PASTA domain